MLRCKLEPFQVAVPSMNSCHWHLPCDTVATFCLDDSVAPSNSAQVWKLSAMDMGDDDIDLVDDDELLDETDLKKPDPNSLKGNKDFRSFVLSHKYFYFYFHYNLLFLYKFILVDLLGLPL